MVLAARDKRLLHGLQLRVQPAQFIRIGFGGSINLIRLICRPAINKEDYRLLDRVRLTETGIICIAIRRSSSPKLVGVVWVKVGRFCSNARSSASRRSRRNSGRTTTGRRLVNGPAECRMNRPAVGERWTMLWLSSTSTLGGAELSNASA